MTLAGQLFKTTLVLAGAGGAAVIGLQKAKELDIARRFSELQSENSELKEKNKELTVDNQRLATANRLLKVEYLLARMRLKGQERDAKNQLVSVVEFWEIDDEGNPLTRPQEYRINGDTVHIEGLVAKFEDSLVEKGDPLRGAAMFAFKSIHGNKDAPDDGYQLASKRTQPSAYARGGLPTEFEQDLWGKFWDYAHDPESMKQLGLRAMHGQGGFMQLQPGFDYTVRLRSTGDITITPEVGRGGVVNHPRRFQP